ncbi:Amino-acid acetyltransferase, mitochondrial [[Candida] zeylanoides]
MSSLRNLNRQFVSNIKTHEAVTAAKRNLILSILKSTTTKREARNYLNKYQSQFDFSESDYANGSAGSAAGAAAGTAFPLASRTSQRELFINRFLNFQNPFLSIYNDTEKVPKVPLRVAVLKIQFTSISPRTWSGIAETVKRLVHLGISPIILLDYDHVARDNFRNAELFTLEQANRVVQALGTVSHTTIDEVDSGLKSTVMRSLFTRPAEHPHTQPPPLAIDSVERLLIPMYQGAIPIIQPLVYNVATTYQEVADTDDLLYTLCSSLADHHELLSIEKIVMIDPAGGIPSIERQHSSHVFINLSQEYSDIVSELYIGHIEPHVRDHHLANLRTMNRILQLCSAKSGTDDATGIITAPHIMAINNEQLNPILYNVLTDRPVISSSLPSSRQLTPHLSTSILKKGMDVSVIDSSSYPGEFSLRNLMRDRFVDERRLVALLNDSFGKRLNVERYFARIDQTVATIIIIGDYDGAAIITHESPSPTRAARSVAYLDKFAIAKRNQGLPGLADVVFKQVLQSSPAELIWRSRKNNPVNKWYFERCVGCMSAPQSQWKIFYTGDVFSKRIRSRGDGTYHKSSHVVDIADKLKDYSEICESIEPSFS